MHYMSRLSPDKSDIMGQPFFLWTVKSTLGSQFIYARATDRGELTFFIFTPWSISEAAKVYTSLSDL